MLEALESNDSLPVQDMVYDYPPDAFEQDPYPWYVRILLNGTHTRTLLMVFMVSFGFFMLVANYSRAPEPPYQAKIADEVATELRALGPFKLIP